MKKILLLSTMLFSIVLFANNKTTYEDISITEVNQINQNDDLIIELVIEMMYLYTVDYMHKNNMSKEKISDTINEFYAKSILSGKADDFLKKFKGLPKDRLLKMVVKTAGMVSSNLKISLGEIMRLYKKFAKSKYHPIVINHIRKL
ncbi:MAG: hypothetical protein CR961_00155 [Polaribacter sp.]|nr:MAG: hypothetical protein CR961_00155 [Polaribacter sp.]